MLTLFMIACQTGRHECPLKSRHPSFIPSSAIFKWTALSQDDGRGRGRGRGGEGGAIYWVGRPSVGQSPPFLSFSGCKPNLESGREEGGREGEREGERERERIHGWFRLFEREEEIVQVQFRPGRREEGEGEMQSGTNNQSTRPLALCIEARIPFYYTNNIVYKGSMKFNPLNFPQLCLDVWRRC